MRREGMRPVLYFVIGLLALGLALAAQPASTLRLVPHGTFSRRECALCRFSVGLVNYALSTNRGASQVNRIANSFCSLAHIESPSICSNTTRLFNYEIVKVLRYGILTPKQVCGLLSNNTCGHFDDPLQDWEVNLNVTTTLSMDHLTKMQQVMESAKVPQKPYRIIHISDTHVDLNYEVGSPAHCAEPLCCHASSTPTKFPSNSVRENSAAETAGVWGAYSTCDAPIRTFESMLKEINRTMSAAQDIDYIIWTGDIQPHDIWAQNKSTAIDTYDAVFRMIQDYLPTARVFPTLGNHEMVPVDSFSPSNLLNIAREDSPEWLYKKIDSYWSRWLPQETIRTVTKDGFYAANARPGLKVVSINTNFCHTSNFWLYINATDPGNQLEWLVHELMISELEQEKVHIIGHIPPGAGDCLKVWSRNFNKIIQRFSKTVTGQFYGHTHKNEFEIFYELNESHFKNNLASSTNSPDTEPWRPISVGWVGPSLTTFINVNPAFRIYNIVPELGHMPNDFTTVYMNLTAANTMGIAAEPNWQPSEPFTVMFQKNDTSPTSMHEFLIETVGDLIEEEKYLLGEENMLYKKLYPFNVLEAVMKPVNTHNKLYKLYKLHNSFSDRANEMEFARMNKKKFLCRFFTGQSHNHEVCNKFIRDGIVMTNAMNEI